MPNFLYRARPRLQECNYRNIEHDPHLRTFIGEIRTGATRFLMRTDVSLPRVSLRGKQGKKEINICVLGHSISMEY